MAMKLSKFILVAVCALLIVLVLLKLVIHQQETKHQLQQEDTDKELVVALNQSCCSTAMQYKVEYLCSREISSLVSHCSCSDYLMCKLVMVTALSSNHFVESIDFFGSVYAYFPQVKIIVYDLGLTMNEVSRIQSYCNVLEVRKFNLTRYPSHIKDLHNYAWKIFIISEMSEEHELFFYCDASCRMKSIIPHYLPNILKCPVLPVSWLPDSIVKTTHDGMLKYLGVQKSRQELEQLLPHGFQAIVIFWANVVLKEKFLPSLVDCASHLECIAPNGSHLWGCYKALKPIIILVVSQIRPICSKYFATQRLWWHSGSSGQAEQNGTSWRWPFSNDAIQQQDELPVQHIVYSCRGGCSDRHFRHFSIRGLAFLVLFVAGIIYKLNGC